jgi:CPA1 family monovalent cation:H+ antiporter
VYYGVGHPNGFPWIAALLTGALLSATDPAAVTALFRAMGVQERLVVLFEGESLFNDALAIVLFGLLLGLALDPTRNADLGLASREFARVFAGGMLSGLACGLLFLALARWRCRDAPAQQGLVTLIAAYSSYLLAESLLAVSGVMAVLACGLILGRLAGETAEPAERHFLQHLWQLNAYVAGALVFLLMGATVTLDMFGERWLAMLIGIGGVLVARALGIFGIVPLLSLLPGVERITLGQQVCLAWGGLRGAVALALALSLPVELAYWWTIQSIAFGVVLFSLLVQAPSMPPLIRRLGLANRR